MSAVRPRSLPAGKVPSAAGIRALGPGPTPLPAAFRTGHAWQGALPERVGNLTGWQAARRAGSRPPTRSPLRPGDGPFTPASRQGGTGRQNGPQRLAASLLDDADAGGDAGVGPPLLVVVLKGREQDGQIAR